MAAIPDLLTHGTVVYYGINPKNAEQRLVAIAGEDFVVTAGIRSDSNGSLSYDHKLMEVRRAEQLSSEPGLPQEKNTALSARLNDITRKFIV